MKKRNIILISLLVLLLLAMNVESIKVPFPISGKVVGFGNDDLNVEISNLRTKEVVNTKTSSEGEWLVDWANSAEGARVGDVFQIKVEDEVFEVEWNGEDCLFKEIQMNVCKCEQEKDWLSIGAGAFLGMIAAFVAFMGGGLKVYKNRLGGIVIQHKHKGVRGYHGADTSHRNLAYRHRRWKDDPMGCIEDVKKIEENGGLI